MNATKIVLSAVAVGLSIGAASAADMPMKAAPIYTAAAPTTPWTGCYLGINAGGGWGRDRWTFTDGTPENSPDFGGWLAGGQLGCDYQSGGLVVGLAGMFDGAGISGSAITPVPPFVTHTKITAFSTATARLGYAVNPAFLFYVDGGAAWVNNQRYYVPTLGPTVSDARVGWTVGLGLEYMVAPSWSVKIEYSYADFGTTGPLPIDSFDGPAGSENVRQQVNTILVGLNFRFGGFGSGPGH
jgi:outer membrane immunogenic protein